MMKTRGQKVPLYKVGRGKPPLHSRWRPGQSGNRNGRPKNLSSLATSLRKELMQKVTVTEGGKRRRMTALEAIIMRVTAKAAQGSTAELKQLLKIKDVLFPKAEKPKERTEPNHDDPRLGAAGMDAIFRAIEAYYDVKVYRDLYGSLLVSRDYRPEGMIGFLTDQVNGRGERGQDHD